MQSIAGPPAVEPEAEPTENPHAVVASSSSSSPPRGSKPRRAALMDCPIMRVPLFRPLPIIDDSGSTTSSASPINPRSCIAVKEGRARQADSVVS